MHASERGTGRRLVLIGAATTVGAVLQPRLLRAAGPILTPRQTEGPFYPIELPTDRDSDLVRVTGAAAQAMGQVTHVMGRALDRQGRPIPGALVEIWQCDANGRYLHPGDRGGPRDLRFQGYGQALTDAGGGYHFRTIRPVPYPGRTPHIHFKVRLRERELLTTQMYVAGEPGNARDGIYRRLDAEERERLTVPLQPADGVESGALAGTFDLVLRV